MVNTYEFKLMSRKGYDSNSNECNIQDFYVYNLKVMSSPVLTVH